MRRPLMVVALVSAMTPHLKRNGVLSGMLSVNSSSGTVWYQTWHGALIAREDS